MSIESKWDGTCAKDKSHTWKAGQQIYYSKSPKATCIYKECYEAQLKAATPTSEPAKDQKPTQVSDISIEKSLARVKAFDDWAWKIANDRVIELLDLKGIGMDNEMRRNKAIAVESIYHTLVEAYNGAR